MKTTPDDYITCPDCLGERRVDVPIWTGWDYGSSRREDCPTCKGTGVVHQPDAECQDSE